jgi:hypothetical protein
MLKLISSEKYDTRYGTYIPGVGVSSSTSQASDKIYHEMINSVKQEPSGTSMSYKSQYQNTLRTLISLYQTSMQGEISIEDAKNVAKGVIRDTFRDLHDLLSWEEGWNGYDACAPNCEAVIYAMDWVSQFFLDVMDLDEDWIRPNVTASGEGEVVLGWRHDHKRLTIYVGEKSAEYVRAWGIDMEKDMDDGDADLPSTRQSLWKWLVG